MKFDRSPARCRAGLTTTLGLLVAATAACILGLPEARAADLETRNFTVQVDGKNAGRYQLTIGRQADGTVSVAAQSDVRVTVLGIPVYTYSYRGQEVWKAGRLQHFESSGKEKGKDFAIRADLDGATLRVTANAQERRARPDVWTSSCWQLPDASFRNNNVVVLGCDTGAETQSRLQFVAMEQIKVAGQMQHCAHYRVMKEQLHDVWYDAQERIVRDEWVTNGHRTVVEMTEPVR